MCKYEREEKGIELKPSFNFRFLVATKKDVKGLVFLD